METETMLYIVLSYTGVDNNKRNHVYFTQFHKNGPSGLIKQVY